MNDPTTSRFNNPAIEEFCSAYREFKAFRERSIPFCAAENVMSPVVRSILNSDLQERYIMGGTGCYDKENNFIGSEFLKPIYDQIEGISKRLFAADYTDPRSLSGTHAATVVFMTLLNHGDEVLISTTESGGHSSIINVAKRLGLVVKEMPYDYSEFDYDYSKINQICNTSEVRALIFAPSDIIKLPDLHKLDIPDRTKVIYDATQTLGLIAGGKAPNPLTMFSSVLVIGGTHKTLPGPTCGISLTKCGTIGAKLDSIVSPKYVRNTQMNQVAALLLSLIELEEFGQQYASEIVKNANILGEALESNGLRVLRLENSYSETHQVFVQFSEDITDEVYRRCLQWGITLNKKRKQLFQNSGLRFGVQEITRMGWTNEEVLFLAKIIAQIANGNPDLEIKKQVSQLQKTRELKYTFDKTTTTRLQSLL